VRSHRRIRSPRWLPCRVSSPRQPRTRLSQDGGTLPGRREDRQGGGLRHSATANTPRLSTAAGSGSLPRSARHRKRGCRRHRATRPATACCENCQKRKGVAGRLGAFAPDAAGAAHSGGHHEGQFPGGLGRSAQRGTMRRIGGRRRGPGGRASEPRRGRGTVSPPCRPVLAHRALHRTARVSACSTSLTPEDAPNCRGGRSCCSCGSRHG
jgi:hypothetical protein